MRVVILTGNNLRHKFMVHQLAKKLDVVGIVFENKFDKKGKLEKNLDPKNQIIINHLEDMEVSGLNYFQVTNNKIDQIPSMHLNHGEVNDTSILKWIADKEPDLIQLYGSSMIKDELLTAFPLKIINLHLGLSPYYRGTGTNFWPLVNKEPEAVGATIHLAVKEADAGNILHQVRPQIKDTDSPHDIGNKALIAGIEQIPNVLKSYYKGVITPQKQDLVNGKVYFRKDLQSEAVSLLYKNFNEGLISDYLQNKSERDSKLPIITVPIKIKR